MLVYVLCVINYEIGYVWFMFKADVFIIMI